MNIEITHFKCKGCSKELAINVIRNHLSQKASCKNKYSQKEEDELARQYETFRKKKRANNYKTQVQNQKPEVKVCESEKVSFIVLHLEINYEIDYL